MKPLRSTPFALTVTVVYILVVVGLVFGESVAVPEALGYGLILTVICLPIALGYLMGWKLHWHIITAMLCGVVFWWIGSKLAFATAFAEPLGTVFIRLLKMVIVPLVMSSIIVGVAGVGNPKNLGRLGFKTFAFYFTTSLFAIVIGLTLTNLIKPGEGVSIDMSREHSASDLERPSSLFEIIIRMIPENPVSAATETDMLGIIFFALLFGFALTQIAGRHRDSVLGFIDGVFHAMMAVTETIIRLAPIGVLGLIVAALNKMDFDVFKAVGLYMATIAIGLTLHLLIVLPLLLKFLTGRSPMQHFKNMANAMATAFSTSSSSATLPVTMECVETNAGVSNKISSFVLPMGATINMDGTALYECAGVLFIAQVLGIDLSLTQQLVVVMTALLASIGAAGIPSAGLVMIFIVLEAVGIEGPTVGVIVGTMLAVDRPLDMYRTVVNIFSDSVGTLIIAHSEGEVDEVLAADTTTAAAGKISPE